MFQPLKSWLTAARTATLTARTPHRFAPQVEALHDRITPTASVSGGNLNIYGTGHDDTVTAWSYPDLTHVADFPVRMEFPRGVTGVSGGVILVWGNDTGSVPVVERFDRKGIPLGRFDLSALIIPKRQLEPKLRTDPTTGRVWVRTRESEQEFNPATGKPISPVSPSPLAYPSPFSTGWATPDDTRFVVDESENKRGPIAYDPRPWYQRGIFLRVRNTTTGAERRWRVAGAVGGPVAVSPDGSRVPKLVRGNWTGS